MTETVAADRVVRRIEWRLDYPSPVLVGNGITLTFPPAAPLAALERMESAALALVFPAMQDRAALVLHGVVSPVFLVGLEEFQRAWVRWRPDRYGRIDVSATRVEAAPQSAAATLAAFSGGIDSAFTMQRHARDGTRPVTGLFMHGFDIPLPAESAFLRALEAAGAMVSSLGRSLIAGATDVRLSCRIDWEDAHGACLGMAAHQLASGFDTFLVPGSTQYHRMMLPWGSNPVTDAMMSSERLRIRQDGVEVTRLEKIAALGDWPAALRLLRVCWEHAHTGGNCGRCEKCVETWLGMRAAGLDPSGCFPAPPTEADVARVRVRSTSDAVEGWKFLSDTGLSDPLHKAFRRALVRFEGGLGADDRRVLAALDGVLPARADSRPRRRVSGTSEALPLAMILSRFAGRLGDIVENRPCAVLDWPDHGNVGDHLIWLGTKLALRRFLGCEVVYECSATEADYDRIAGLPPETVLLFHGGGNFGDLYPLHQRFRESVLERFPDRDIVALPQSVCFRDPAERARSVHAYDAHPALTVFLRDAASLGRIRSVSANPRYELAPDAALFLADLMPALLARLPPAGPHEAVQLLRADGEHVTSRAAGRLVEGDGRGIMPGFPRPLSDVHSSPPPHPSRCSNPSAASPISRHSNGRSPPGGGSTTPTGSRSRVAGAVRGSCFTKGRRRPTACRTRGTA